MISELTFKIKHECPYLNFFKASTLKKMYSFCNSQTDVIMMNGSLEEGKNTEIFESYLGVITNWNIVKSDKFGSTYLISSCNYNFEKEQYVRSVIHQNKCLPIEPIVYENDVEIHRVICFNEKQLSNTLNGLQRFDDLKIISIKSDAISKLFDHQVVTVSSLLKDLTEKQLSLMLYAQREGYYKLPRSITRKEMATEFGKTRQGIEKTLKSGENVILNHVLQYLDFGNAN